MPGSFQVEQQVLANQSTEGQDKANCLEKKNQ